MDSNTRNILKTTVGVAMAVSGTVASPAVMALAATPAPDAAVVSQAAGTTASAMTEVANVQGTFAYDQSTVTPNGAIAAKFAKATASICNATSDFTVTNPLAWEIEVTGDVSNSYVTSVDKIASDEAVSSVMTCTCGGNPAGGKAIFNGEVKGIPVEYLIGLSDPDSDVNTVTFYASDGKSVSLSTGYVVGRHAVLAYDINGEDLSASVGGNNELWLAGAPASTYLRDIVKIEVTHEATAPANPVATGTNSPNVGIEAAAALA